MSTTCGTPGVRVTAFLLRHNFFSKTDRVRETRTCAITTSALQNRKADHAQAADYSLAARGCQPGIVKKFSGRRTPLQEPLAVSGRSRSRRLPA